MSARTHAYGAGAALVDLGLENAPDRAARTHALAEALRAAWPDADVIVGAGTVAVVGVAPKEVRRVAAGSAAPRAHEAPRTHVIAAAYDGPDLTSVAEALGITTDEVIARHAATEYVVELLGFLPGFAYLSAPSGASLVVPRRSAPRPKVPAGSIGVAAAFMGIYPFASPGGWNLIARAIDTLPFDPSREPPVLFAPGDHVRFTPSEPRSEQRASAGGPEPRASASGPHTGLLVIAAPACATVQDGGRIGQLGRGIPPSGPLDPETFAAANVAVGNHADAAAIEIPLGALELEARGTEALVSIDGEPATLLRDGDRLRVPTTERAVRYLAVRGGIAVPRVLGARATLLAAGIGGLGGRALRKRDVLPIGDDIIASPTKSPAIADTSDLAIDPGPHLDRFPAGAYDALLSTTFQVSRLGDRVGVRLEGGRIPREGPDLALPVPMIRGAVEVTTDGTPIVLGPDHPTTGGYPVIAVLRAPAQAALARKKPGETLRFCAGR